MGRNDEDHRQAVALFRYGVIAVLLTLAPGSAELRRALHDATTRSWDIPGTRRTRVAEQTIRDWMRHYRRGGFEALKPKRRTDRGKPRRMGVETIETVLAIKRDRPRFSVRQVIEEAHRSGAVTETLAPSSVHRLLSREGLMTRLPPAVHDRRRFQMRWAGELWQSDVMHGPKCGDGRGRRRRTYLIAFLDDATRVIPHAAFTFAESTAAFLPVFKQALIRRGLPLKLYVDNGANYRSTQLAVICARLNIALIHAKPFSPAGKGKIERYFRTCRAGCLAHLQDSDLVDLEALNRRFRAWLEGEYHVTPHRGLDGMTPLDKWAATSDNLRLVGPMCDIDTVFLLEATRRVNRDRTVSLRGHLYEVDAALVGEKVTLLFDPAVPPERPLQVRHNGHDAGLATWLDSHANSHVRRHGDGLSFRKGDGEDS